MGALAMATEKQIRANRENAKKSTGPKTAGGRARSSRNALRHGLSLPLTLNTEMAAKADLIRKSLVSEQGKPTRALQNEPNFSLRYHGLGNPLYRAVAVRL